MQKTKLVKIRGHYRKQIVGYKIKVDPDNPANEVEVPEYRTIYVEPYVKAVKYEDAT